MEIGARYKREQEKQKQIVEACEKNESVMRRRLQ